MNDFKYGFEPVKWHTEWALITNKYGQLLSYNLPRYHNSYSKCTYQKYIIDMLETKKYDIFLDVGAHMGLFSQVGVHNCKYVYAYEAQPFFYGVLLNNMKLYDNITCKYAYVSKKDDVPMIDKNNFMRMVVIDQTNVVYNIDVIVLDEEYKQFRDMFPNARILIKLDIEGSELKALEASPELKKNKNVHWIIDVHPPRGVSVEDVKGQFVNRKITQIGKKVLKIE